MHELIEKAKGCNGTILDNDGTLSEGNYGKSIGYGTLGKAAKSFNIPDMLEGLYGVMKIKASAWKNGEEEDARNQSILFQSMGKTGKLQRGTAYYLAEKHRKNKKLEGIEKFIEELKTLGPVFVVTQGSSIAADVVRKAYNLAGMAANPVVYLAKDGSRVADSPFAYEYSIPNPMLNEESIVVDCEGIFNNAKKKKEGAQKLIGDFDIGEMLAIGDKHSIDSETLKAAKFSASSPLADDETKENVDYNIESYVC
jgi:hypothetical protein